MFTHNTINIIVFITSVSQLTAYIALFTFQYGYSLACMFVSLTMLPTPLRCGALFYARIGTTTILMLVRAEIHKSPLYIKCAQSIFRNYGLSTC